MQDEQAKRPVGRPPFKEHKKRGEIFRMRVLPKEKASYERAAKNAGSADVSSWARDVLNRAVREPAS